VLIVITVLIFMTNNYCILYIYIIFINIITVIIYATRKESARPPSYRNLGKETLGFDIFSSGHLDDRYM
jgi:nicotinamide riboside transporter PnuC